MFKNLEPDDVLHFLLEKRLKQLIEQTSHFLLIHEWLQRYIGKSFRKRKETTQSRKSWLIILVAPSLSDFLFASFLNLMMFAIGVKIKCYYGYYFVFLVNSAGFLNWKLW